MTHGKRRKSKAGHICNLELCLYSAENSGAALFLSYAFTQSFRKDNLPLAHCEKLRGEVEWAIKNLTDGKAPGCDGLTADIIKLS